MRVRSGLSGLRGYQRGGLGDTLAQLQQAQAKLSQAGYTGVNCETQTVTYPGNPGGSYNQDICSADGFMGGMMVGLVLASSLAQLEAQRALEVSNGACQYWATKLRPNLRQFEQYDNDSEYGRSGDDSGYDSGYSSGGNTNTDGS